MTLLAFTVGSDWSTPAVIIGLILVGLGEGTTLTLLFNVLVSASPKELAGDVGALRGVVNNVSSALGAAFAGVVAVGLLGLLVTQRLGCSRTCPPRSGRRSISTGSTSSATTSCRRCSAQTSVTPEQVDEAVRINEAVRLRALQATFLLLAAISLLALIPSLKLPNYMPGELSADDIVSEKPPARQRR